MIEHIGTKERTKAELTLESGHETQRVYHYYCRISKERTKDELTLVSGHETQRVYQIIVEFQSAMFPD